MLRLATDANFVVPVDILAASNCMSLIFVFVFLRAIIPNDICIF